MKLKHLALVMTGLLVLSSCGGGSGGDKAGLPDDALPPVVTNDNPTVNASAIVYNDIAVHDPSIIKDADGTYYAFGSHLAVAKSSDLMKWEYISSLTANEKVDESSLFNTYSSEIAEGIEWTDGYKGNWAADVIKAPNGKYWFYYNHCAQEEAKDPQGKGGGCWNRSYLGLAESDSIKGPYVDKGVFLRSGYRNAGEFTSYPLDNGQTTYNGAVHPNVIDPHAFLDKAGKLWLVYGSYSGGIFILELDTTTGKPKAGKGYGKLLAGGGGAPIEGTWITYSPETDYYYMFNSFGGFAAADGYNIRVSRSKTPDGTYVDAAGNDMLLAKTNIETLSKYGVKLMGGFNFVSEKGDKADLGASWGYLSPGHNSVYYDASAKKYFLVTHTRFPNRGEEHSIRVHEMWLNNDGWFVASPQRYAPIAGTNIVDAVDLQGEYRFINHDKDSNRTGHNSVYIRLTDARTVTGEVTGYYRLSETDKKRITLVLGGETYEGVMAWQWDDVQKKLVPTFSAVSTKGVSVWGSKIPTRTTGENLTAIAADLTLPAEYIDPTLSVPLRGTRGAEITWVSSNPAIINLKVDKKTGKQTGVAKVNRPSMTAGDQVVTLTATISLNGQTTVKTVQVKILAQRFSPATAQFDFEGNLTDAKGNFPAGLATGDRITNTGTVAYATGWSGQAVSLNGTNGVLLPDSLISNYEYTVSFMIKPAAITKFTTAFFGAIDVDNWLSFQPMGWNDGTMLWGRVPQWYDAITGVAIPANEWSRMAFSVNHGAVDVYINGQKKFSGTNFGDLFTGKVGKFALGVNYWDVPFNGLIDDLRIHNVALTPDELKIADPGNKPAAEVLELAKAALTLGDVSAVKEDLDLPVAGPYTAAVSWKSLNTAAMDDVGTITQPSATQPDATVTLVATITYGGQSTTKEFVVTVKSKAPPAPVASYSFEDNLDEKSGLASGIVTGAKVNETGGSVSYTAGVVGKAVVLDGAGVKLADNLIKDHSYTVSLWLNPASVTQFTTAFFGWATDSSWISVVPRGPGDAQHTMLWSGTAWFDGTLKSQIPVGSWSHVLVTVDSGKFTAYLNGVAVNTMTGFPDVFTPAGTTQFSLGVNLWDVPYKGQIDEVKVYDEVLTADDVGIVYGEGAPK